MPALCAPPSTPLVNSVRRRKPLSLVVAAALTALLASAEFHPVQAQVSVTIDEPLQDQVFADDDQLEESINGTASHQNAGPITVVVTNAWPGDDETWEEDCEVSDAGEWEWPLTTEVPLTGPGNWTVRAYYKTNPSVYDTVDGTVNAPE
jgi:hypothetical protein